MCVQTERNRTLSYEYNIDAVEVHSFIYKYNINAAIKTTRHFKYCAPQSECGYRFVWPKKEQNERKKRENKLRLLRKLPHNTLLNEKWLAGTPIIRHKIKIKYSFALLLCVKRQKYVLYSHAPRRTIRDRTAIPYKMRNGREREQRERVSHNGILFVDGVLRQ